ncbi:hypothetical protein X975_07360, partial [Stegodyphus mimosarum]
MMDEIHIKPYLDFRGGNIVGSSFNAKDAATSAYVFMIRSNSDEGVRILAVKTITADVLYFILKKTVIGLENIGFFMVCVVSGNDSLNRKATCYFSNLTKLSIVYSHPVKTDRPLFM